MSGEIEEVREFKGFEIFYINGKCSINVTYHCGAENPYFLRGEDGKMDSMESYTKFTVSSISVIYLLTSGNNHDCTKSGRDFTHIIPSCSSSNSDN